MRHLLLRLLLLTVFFNTALGMPLHEAGHLQHAVKGTEQVDSLFTVEGRPAPAEHGDEHADGLCAWCSAHAQQAMALTAPPVIHTAVNLPEGIPAPALSIAFVPSPGHWPFASRDPPHLSA